VLIDAGMDSTGADVQALLSEMGHTFRDVRALLITHWHNDHAAGARATQLESGCSVHYDAAERPWLTRQTAKLGLRGWLSKRIPEWGIGVLFIGLLGEAVPNAIEATHFLRDGEEILDEFDVVSTPGHTVGHASFFHRPTRSMFAGDALAAIDGKIRFMARPVTPDLQNARASMQKCLSFDIGLLCPGHRTPITRDVERSCDQMREYLAAGGHWPFFG
jgi:glyoxylase-like metal-dependent hydrolase (beta-lactamase superfamily II)